MKNRTYNDDDVAPEVTDAVGQWVTEADELLGRLQIAIEVMHAEPTLPSDSKRVIADLLAVIRQLRAEAPRPEAVSIWLRALASDTGTRWLRRPARFMNAAHFPPPKSPTGA